MANVRLIIQDADFSAVKVLDDFTENIDFSLAEYISGGISDNKWKNISGNNSSMYVVPISGAGSLTITASEKASRVFITTEEVPSGIVPDPGVSISNIFAQGTSVIDISATESDTINFGSDAKYAYIRRSTSSVDTTPASGVIVYS